MPSWAIGATLGGTATVLYGAILCTVFYLATAASLAELASVYAMRCMMMSPYTHNC